MNALARASILFALVSVTALSGCASGPRDSASALEGEHPVVHQTTAADADHLKVTKPIASDRVRLYVNGMGCPQCVSNIDLQLAKVAGVKSTRVNLGTGTVDVDFLPVAHPSPAQINKAVGGDFTLVRIEELK
jgi:copper chaperone CopZ